MSNFNWALTFLALGLALLALVTSGHGTPPLMIAATLSWGACIYFLGRHHERKIAERILTMWMHEHEEFTRDKLVDNRLKGRSEF